MNRKTSRHVRRTGGFTLIELLVVIAIIALLISLLLPALARAQRNARSVKDSTQMKQVHQAMLIFANDNKDILPTPGLISRLPYNCTDLIPGLGMENTAKNHTRHLYSALIAQEFFNPDLVIGPTEVNSSIREYTGYDYSKHDPAGGTYWDGDTVVDSGCDPTDPGPLNANPEFLPGEGFPMAVTGQRIDASATSYAHMAIAGQRKRLHWRNNQNPSTPIIATRGTGGSYKGQPFGGAITGDEYTKSPTLELHRSRRQWSGNVVFSDNHTETLDSFFPPQLGYRQNTPGAFLQNDNMYAAEFTDFEPDARASADGWVGIFSEMQQAGDEMLPRGITDALLD